MKTFRFQRIETYTTSYIIEVSGQDDPMLAEVKASVGPMSHVREKEGVEIVNIRTTEETKVHRLS